MLLIRALQHIKNQNIGLSVACLAGSTASRISYKQRPWDLFVVARVIYSAFFFFRLSEDFFLVDRRMNEGDRTVTTADASEE